MTTTEASSPTQIDYPHLTGDYTIDTNHSRFGFVARHAMVTRVRGQFNQFSGSLRLDGDRPFDSSGELIIEAASIDTRNSDRDAHVRSNDFLAMEEYPQITFRTTSVEGGPERYLVTGDLTVRGVTKPVPFEVEMTGAAIDPWGQTRVGFEGTAVVNRKDWGVNWNAALEAGGVLVSEKVTLEFEISAIKA